MKLGAKVRALRRREALTQAQLAERLGISASYLNLIENNRRTLSAPVLIKLAQLFDLDLQAFAQDDHDQTVADLMEVLSDPMFETHQLTQAEVRDLATNNPNIAA
ncbi:MAG: helix-turn-helix transcriptional regulator, partial [Myxococcota bacterium]